MNNKDDPKTASGDVTGPFNAEDNVTVTICADWLIYNWGDDTPKGPEATRAAKLRAEYIAQLEAQHPNVPTPISGPTHLKIAGDYLYVTANDSGPRVVRIPLSAFDDPKPTVRLQAVDHISPGLRRILAPGLWQWIKALCGK